MSTAIRPTPEYLRRLKKMDLRILGLLAERGPLNQYRISKGIDADYPTTHKAIKGLETDGFVKFEHEELTEKGGRAKVYGLTLKGLISLITMGVIKKNIDEVMAKWSHLSPLIFGKWDYLKEMGLEDEIFRLLQMEGEVIYLFKYPLKDEKQIWSEDVIKAFLMFYFRNLMLTPKYWEIIKRWIKAIRGDEEIKAWMIEMLEGDIVELKAFILIIKEAIDAIKAVEEPDWEEIKKRLTTLWNVSPQPLMGERERFS